MPILYHIYHVKEKGKVDQIQYLVLYILIKDSMGFQFFSSYFINSAFPNSIFDICLSNCKWTLNHITKGPLTILAMEIK